MSRTRRNWRYKTSKFPSWITTWERRFTSISQGLSKVQTLEFSSICKLHWKVTRVKMIISRSQSWNCKGRFRASWTPTDKHRARRGSWKTRCNLSADNWERLNRNSPGNKGYVNKLRNKIIPESSKLLKRMSYSFKKSLNKIIPSDNNKILVLKSKLKTKMLKYIKSH